jgi:hypothetical protein
MTRDEAVAIVHQQLGFRSDQANNIVTYMQLAQQTLEKGRTLPWWLRSERSYIYTTANEQRVPIPSDFLREEEGNQLTYIPAATAENTDYVPLDKDFADHLEARYLTLTGPPEAYALDGVYFRIFPTPDDAYQIRMVYAKRDTILTSNIENLWLKHLPYLLIGVAGGMMATSLRDKEAQATFRGWAQEGLGLMYAENDAREHTNMDYQIGGPH